MLFEIILYNKDRSKVALIQTDAGLDLPHVFVTTFIGNYKTFIEKWLMKSFAISSRFERCALIQFEESSEKSCFIFTLVYRTDDDSETLNWFSLKELPPALSEMTLRALRAEMHDITYEIPEIKKGEESCLKLSLL